MKHEVSEGEKGVDGGLLVFLGAALNGVQPGSHHDVILAIEEVIRRDSGREEVPRGRELATPVTHGGAVARDAVDVADVNLGPLAVEPEAVDIRGRVGNCLGKPDRLLGGDHGGATISPTSSSHRLDTLRRLFAPLYSSSGSLSRSAKSDSSELSPSMSSSTEKVKRWRGTDKFCL